ncbi:hypothetical protein K7X08_035466 [Anisodus acutangulus]|uniref:Uncharacterized protein n=1 Tax=Anisodus acutangulus TaxID=402998 RepID=A0A9Q1LKJ7_9SOLA|nr:hypothetical protein K7X08_035466 [Anisodus acutangulus]
MTSRKRKEHMDDVPQFEEGTTIVPEVSESPEVDTTEEIVRKRKEEEISLRFVELGSKELYLAGLEVKNDGKMTWVIYEENRPRVITESRVDHSPEGIYDEEEYVNDRSEKLSEDEPGSDVGDEELESVRSIVRASCVQGDEVDTVLSMQMFVEKLREQRGKSVDGAGSSSAPCLDIPLPPSVGLVSTITTSVEPAPSSEIDPIGQSSVPYDTIDGDTTQTYV